MVGQSALACSVALWANSDTTTVIVGTPIEAVLDDRVPRYSGECGMKNRADQADFVEDDSPGGINRIRARFYVFTGHSGEARVYSGFDSGSRVFDVTVNGDTGEVTFSTAGGQVSCPSPNCPAANSAAWNSIEIDWDADQGNMALWVNTDANEEPNAAATDAFTPGAQVTNVRLGNLDGASGTMYFDAYESRRQTAIGRLLRGDANADGNVTVFDAIAVVNETGSTPTDPNLSRGQPDCNEDGGVTIFDAICIVNVANSNV
jgi:hypothetical protein